MPNVTKLSTVERLIAAEGIDARIIQPGAPTPTVTDAARALNTSESQILKTLLFTSADEEAILAIACGPARISIEALQQASHLSQLRLASPGSVSQLTGYPVGAVPPIGHRDKLATIVDEQVMHHEVVFGGGGTTDTLLEIRPQDIVRLTGAQICSIVED